MTKTFVSMMTTQWNTRRLYQHDGQRIRAELVVDGKGARVLFADFSRGIFGEFDVDPADLPMGPGSLETRTMRAYDRTGGYRMSCEAMQLRWKD